MKLKNKYFQFNRIDDSITELFIYGDIAKPDWIEKWLEIEDETKVNAFSFKDALAEVDTPNLLVRINSYGGEVSEGLAIYSLLSDYKGHLITKVDGMACSAASIIFMAGKERIMPESGLLMIHNAWRTAVGDPNELRKAADDLETITKPSVNIYVSKTGLSEEEVKQMMDIETWMDCHEAFAKGFATSIAKDDEAQQSLGDVNLYIKKLVSQNKELKKTIENANLNVQKEDALVSFLNLERKED